MLTSRGTELVWRDLGPESPCPSIRRPEPWMSGRLPVTMSASLTHSIEGFMAGNVAAEVGITAAACFQPRTQQRPPGAQRESSPCLLVCMARAKHLQGEDAGTQGARAAPGTPIPPGPAPRLQMNRHPVPQADPHLARTPPRPASVSQNRMENSLVPLREPWVPPFLPGSEISP